MAIKSFAYDSVEYNAGEITTWLYSALSKENGVIPAIDSALFVANNGTGGVNISDGIAMLFGRTGISSGGPTPLLLGTLPASGFRTAYAIVMRFNTANQTTSFISIVGNTIANPGPAVNPSIVSSTDILLAYVLAVNTAGTIVYTDTDGRTFNRIGNKIFTITSAKTYVKHEIPFITTIIANLSSPSVINITDGAANIGSKLYFESTTVNASTLRIKSGGTGTGYDITVKDNEWVYLLWNGSMWIIIDDGFTTEKAFTYTSTGAFSHTVPAGRTRLRAKIQGAGGGGGGGASSPSNLSNTSPSGGGTSISTARTYIQLYALPGGNGNPNITSTLPNGCGNGGESVLGKVGIVRVGSTGIGGSRGGGGGAGGLTTTGSGGGGGGYLEVYVDVSPAESISGSIAAGGAGGASTGTGGGTAGDTWLFSASGFVAEGGDGGNGSGGTGDGYAGGAGGDGVIVITYGD